MSEKTLKFDNIEVNKNKFHASKQAIDLSLVDINKIVISGKFEHSDKDFKYLLATKMIILLDRYVLFCLKWVDLWNILKTEEKICLIWLKMKVFAKYNNIIVFGTKLKRH